MHAISTNRSMRERCLWRHILLVRFTPSELNYNNAVARQRLFNVFMFHIFPSRYWGE